MNNGYPNPSQILPLFFKINRQARIRWTITQDSSTPNTTGWTWQLFIKRNPGDRLNAINLTLGNGLRYEIYSDTILVADFSALQTKLEEGEYYYELVRTDIETTWVEGGAYFQFAKTSTDTIEESNFTINVDSNGSPITISLTSAATYNITNNFNYEATVVSSSITAANDILYHVTASATFTDPTGVEGKGYTVFVRNGTATVGGTGYSLAGLTIKRIYYSASWTTELILPDTTDEVAITDAATMDIAAYRSTLATSSATRTFTISWPGDFFVVTITLSATTSVLTFPSNTLCVYGGVASGNNTMTLSGSSGDVYELCGKKRGATYTILGVNCGQ